MVHVTHVVFGTGPAGCWIARALREQGLPVRAVNRSGSRPSLMPADVELVAANVSVPAQAIMAAEGAAVIYQAANPPYHQWHLFFPGLQAGALAAAKAVGARYVSIENLYMYDSSAVMTEDSRVAPRSKKGELRARMAEEVMRAHRAGEVRATALRSSDYYGPGVLGSAFGDRTLGALVAGKKAQVLGAADKPHSFAYIEDVGKAAVALGLRDEALGIAWIAPHAPALTQHAMVGKACSALGIEPRYTVVGPAMLRLAGLFVPGAKASVEMMYQFTEPFVVDSGRFEQAFDMKPTPLDTGLLKTAEWYRASFRR